MRTGPRVAFIGAGSAVFTRNIVGDLLLRPALAGARIALMDIDAERLATAGRLVSRLAEQLGTAVEITTHDCQRAALAGADFVIVAFQIGGYEPCTVTDFEIPKRYGLRQTIADTLGIGGIMRGLRTVPHLFRLCADMRECCPEALLLQYVNPMAINMWAIQAQFPDVASVGLCHSVQGTAAMLARDCGVPRERLRYRCAGINHMAFFLTLEEQRPDGSRRDLYPVLRAGLRDGRLPQPNPEYPNCPEHVRYEVMTRLGYFVTESSEHFAEYVPWFLKSGRPDLVERFGIPLDEYCRRVVEQNRDWAGATAALLAAETAEHAPSLEYAAGIVESVWTGRPGRIHGNLVNHDLVPSLPPGCAVEVPCLVDGNGVAPLRVGALPPQLAGLMRSNVNVQELVVAALLEERREHVYHAAMLDPHTAAELDLDQICALVDELIAAHGDWLPGWLTGRPARA